MRIDRNNYEAYFIDYLEGNLDENLIDEFIEFIGRNPDLKAELTMLNPIPLEPDSIVFEKKETLYRPDYESENVFNQQSVAFMEGDLSPKEETQFLEYLSAHPAKKAEIDIFAKTRLVPDDQIVYSKKEQLYRKSAGKSLLMWSLRIAAVLIVALAVFSLTRNADDTAFQNQQAVITNEKPEQPFVSEEPVIIPESPKETAGQPVQEDNKAAVDQPLVPVKKNSIKEELAEPPVQEYIADNREPAEVPAKIVRIKPSVRSLEGAVAVEVDMVPVEQYAVVVPEQAREERFIADVVKEKTGLQNLSFDMVTKAGLNLVSAISKEKFTYETNTYGEITELSLDTRLLAISIPTSN